MKLFADSGFIIGLLHPDDNNHKAASAIWQELTKKGIVKGYNDIWISSYVLVEIFHHLQKNIQFKDTLRYYNELKNCRLYQIKKKQVDDAIHTKLKPFCNHHTGNPSIGLVDATSLCVMDIVKVPFILSFDEGFDHYPFYHRIGEVKDIEEKIVQ
jgi:predicted nucleic acid-binding protein